MVILANFGRFGQFLSNLVALVTFVCFLPVLYVLANFDHFGQSWSFHHHIFNVTYSLPYIHLFAVNYSPPPIHRHIFTITYQSPIHHHIFTITYSPSPIHQKKYKKKHRQIQKILSTNPKKIVNKSKKNCWQIQK